MATTIREIRRANLVALLSRYQTKVEFAAAADLAPGHVSQMASGNRNIGETVARRIEARLSLPNGWMDRQHDTPPEAESFDLGPDIRTLRRAPLVGTAQLGMDGYWNDLEYPTGQGDGYIEIPSRDQNVYTLRVRGSSMAPAINNGWLVSIEPNQDAIPGEYVLLKLKDGRKTIKLFLHRQGDVIAVQSVNDGSVYEFWVDELEQDRGMQYVSGVYPPSRLRLG